MVDLTVCKSCSAPVAPGHAFCPRCGAALGVTESASGQVGAAGAGEPSSDAKGASIGPNDPRLAAQGVAPPQTDSPAAGPAASAAPETIDVGEVRRSTARDNAVRAAAAAREAAAKAAGPAKYAGFLKTKPWLPPPPSPTSPEAPRSLFNGMIAPLLPGAVRGILWYQGEGNGSHPGEYHALLAAMITAWRAHWGQGDVPFYLVQLPNFSGGNPAGTDWARLREAQAQALSLPNTGMAVTIDIGDPDNIHPRNKQEVGRRLALIARHHLYNIPGDWS